MRETSVYSTMLGGRKLSVEIGRLAELAGGSALMTYGDTVVLVTATTSEKPRAGIDWFPLSVDYEERFYAVGKIPGSWFRREGRPTEHAILASRLIDRPIRPLFPDDYRNDVGVVATVMSMDQDASPEVAAMIGSSIALSISEIPFNGPTSAVNIGLVDGELVVNPDAAQREVSKLALTVSSTRDKVMMIEAGADEVSEEVMFDAIMLAHEENKKIIAFIDEIVAAHGKPKRDYERNVLPEGLYEKVTAFITDERMEAAVFSDLKQVRDENLAKLREDVDANLAPTFDALGEEVAAAYKAALGTAMYDFEKATVRRMILRQGKRPDGRGMGDIRQLTAEVDLLPRTHGSAVFRRGQTEVLTVTTLGSGGDIQKLDGLDEAEESKRYMHHYNFPSFSVGETRPSRGPGRREIGHGALAERALLPVIPSEDDFPYAIRLVSEVTSSNGSTSQASVCASTLSLMAAGVPIKAPVAGISAGLVTGDNENDYVLLADIQGLEDFFGDMDFKVAGTKDGITAIQMDIKIDGLTPEIIKASLEQTKHSRFYILDSAMLPVISEPRAEISPYAPKMAIVRINVDQIAEVIGSRGKTIKRIIEESGVAKIDTEDDGRVFVSDTDQAKVDKAVAMIKAIVTVPEVGTIFTGKVTRIMNFGAFVEFAPEKEGLVHVSQWDVTRVENMETATHVGEEVTVMVTEVDDQGRINLSRKGVLDPTADTTVKRPPPRDRNGGGRDRDRRGGDRDRNRGDRR
ncbi:MAG: polyribonucleotide nucleotidyltransferase [Defluviitaleaceae bacterium]|nr:polyribonucleotide nucleotidyltransferase [Defluviitaleaceae bacterium]